MASGRVPTRDAMNTSAAPMCRRAIGSTWSAILDTDPGGSGGEPALGPLHESYLQLSYAILSALRELSPSLVRYIRRACPWSRPRIKILLTTSSESARKARTSSDDGPRLPSHRFPAREEGLPAREERRGEGLPAREERRGPPGYSLPLQQGASWSAPRRAEAFRQAGRAPLRPIPLPVGA